MSEPQNEQRIAQGEVDGGGAGDEVSYTLTDADGNVKVKGPDPNVWGDDADRPMAASDMPDPMAMDYEEILNEGTPEQVKGPSESWRERHDLTGGVTSEG